MEDPTEMMGSTIAHSKTPEAPAYKPKTKAHPQTPEHTVNHEHKGHSQIPDLQQAAST